MKRKKRLAAGLLAGLILLGALSGCAAPGGGDGGAPTGEAPRDETPSAARDGMRGVWVATVYNLDYPDKGTVNADTLRAQADDILENSAEMGMNAVFLQVRPSCDALYPSELFPWSRYLTGTAGVAPGDGFDPLAYWIEKAHALGLELHAWINPFRVTKSGEDEWKALPAGSPAAEHPEWVVEYENNYYLDPGIPQVRELVVQGAEELARKYDLDGIHLDDYFYPGRNFNDEATFAAYGEAFDDLGDWRRDNVNQLIQTLDQRIHAIKPGISFGVSPSGVWADSTHQSAGSATTGNYESYDAAYADSRKWVQKGWVDYICPQIYWPIGHATMDYETIARWWSKTVEGTGVKLYIGMADYQADKDDPKDPWYGMDALNAQLDLNRALGVDGEVHFRYKFLSTNTHLRDLYKTRYGSMGPPPAPGGNGEDGGDLAAREAAFLAGLPEAERLHWAAPYFGALGAMGVVTGKPDGSYAPDETVDRASMAALVCRALSYRAVPLQGGGALTGPFSQAVGSWAEPQIAALAAAGCLAPADYPLGFQPAEPMTRMEIVKLLVRAMGWQDDGTATEVPFADVSEGAYYVAKSQELGLVTGYDDGLFHPDAPVDRAQAAALVYRFLEAI